jgi:phenylalanyl-tRNA synthetase beta chain
MKVLYDWLKEFVDVKAPPEELRTRLSLAGMAVDAIEASVAGPVLDAEITANRPDCLGHYGVAREIAAAYRLPLKPVRAKLVQSAERALDATQVDIEAPELCGRYTARILLGVQVEPSPDWLRQRLEALGQNSINNVVDITNYVQFELGQPLHAFDLDHLEGRRIIVRRARPGEKMRTLDGAERALQADMCVISDAKRAVSVGGVMGGAGSEISVSSRNILLEAAWFDPISIRRTSKALGLRTEASYRFERGVDPDMAELASGRAAELLQRFGGGEILRGVVDVYPRQKPPLKLEFARKELLRVMGADVPDGDIEEVLGALGFAPVRTDPDRRQVGSPAAVWECQQPSWRQDVSRGIDLVEEVARHYGYDRFPPRLPPSRQPAHRLPHAEAQDRLRERVVALGYQEIVEIPLVDPARDAIFRSGKIRPAVIANPLAEDASLLRSNGIVSMLGALEWNLNHGQRNLRLFEFGKTYELRDREPVEMPVLTIGATGLACRKTIHEQAREFEFADLKGDLDRIGELGGGFRWLPGGPEWFADGRRSEISLRSDGDATGRRGIAGELASRIADQLKLRQAVFVAELWLEPLLTGIEAARAALRLSPLPRFPAVERDFSLLLADGIKFAQVTDTVRALRIEELQRIEAADLFRGGQIPRGKFSLMIRVTFQSSQGTLTDLQLSGFSERIVAALEHDLGATLRAN